MKYITTHGRMPDPDQDSHQKGTRWKVESTQQVKRRFRMVHVGHTASVTEVLTMSPLGWTTAKVFLTLLLILKTKQKPSSRKQKSSRQVKGLIFDNCNPSTLKTEAE